ncbi:MAG: macro domain-containing protein [Bacilli bacterium]|nr:macro domain-containing protein [Bacilli bacterium]
MIKLVDGDITGFEGDAITNAANSWLRQGGGVCGAIFGAAGSFELAKACSEIGYCPTGDACITPGFALKAKYIIHAVGPVYHADEESERQLRRVYQNIIRVARENHLKSVAVPSISTGIFGYPIELAAPIAVEELSKAEDIEFTVYCFSIDVRQAYMEALG